MTLANGHPYLAIPGPSVIPDRVQRAMHRGSPNIYEGGLLEMVDSLWPDLRMLAGTTGHVAAYIANGHGALGGGECQPVLAWRQGAGAGLRAVRAQLGQLCPRRWGSRSRCWISANPLRPIRTGWRLRCGPTRRASIKAVLTTHVDTATTIRNDIPALRARDRCSRTFGAVGGGLHRLDGLRRVPDGRLGRGCDGGGQPEGADDAARHGLRLVLGIGAGALRGGRSGHALLALGPACRGRGILAAVGRHRADDASLWPARGADHADA